MTEYSKFFDKHYELVAKIDERVINFNGIPGKKDFDDELNRDLADHVDGINLKSLFSLAK